MGCCEVNRTNAYLSPIQMHHSILLKEKRKTPSPKTVRFEISFTNFKSLIIEEEHSPNWYESILHNDYSSWESHIKSDRLDFSYFLEDSKIFTMLKLKFNFEISHECLICLVNNPKYRVGWDTSLKRIEILIGDNNLDAHVSLLVDSSENSQVYERKVRKLGEIFCLYYLPHKQETLDSYFLLEVNDKRTVKLYFKENFQGDLTQFLDAKKNWAMRLFAEVMVYQMF